MISLSMASTSAILESIANPASSLSAPELRRRDALVDDVARERFIARRAWLRRLLADVLLCAPSEVILQGARAAKPMLANPGAYLSFSQSSAADLTVVAMTGGSPVGVDIEQVVDFDFAALRPRVLAPAAWARIAATGWARASFYKHWTAMEAVVKATGEGLAAGAGAYDADPVSGRVTALRGPTNPGLRVTTRMVAGYCLAVAAPSDEIELFDHDRGPGPRSYR